ncbi:spore coat U domain-containing protein [Pseudomonas aeruginosa]|uniref:Csu type fimbrial protein n=1 Tax=Pseudomonas aeruginosa TaxID=287 RepID=UPI001F2FD98D|nr:spore coat U domain-containing protein [Pseudomonas aeruginosa]MDG3687374.1 spore coat U domain-containing protein [Pseudomonas aeruginosa]MDG3716963.1 spore coat U domain-containing protein [Pseudomonas aeruginosa]
MSRHSTSACLLGFATLCASPLLLAACTTSSGTGNFGSLSSFTVASTAQTIIASTGFKCTGSQLSLVSTNTIDATIASSSNSLGNTPRLYNRANGTYLPYSICKDKGCAQNIYLGTEVRWSSRTLVGILGLFNSSDGSLPLYLRTATSVLLPAGTYTDTINLKWSWSICTIGVLGVCRYDTGTATSSINITLTVLKDCFIDSAPNVNFGSAALISGFSMVKQNIGVRCSPNTNYTIGLDNGNNFSGGWRRMLSGTNAIEYNLYKPGDSMVWNTTNTHIGTGSGTRQNVPYQAIVNPLQGNAPIGVYTDTVRIIVTY